MKCKECGSEDPTGFYEGVKTYCRTHWKARVKKNREDKKDYYLRYDRNRPNKNERNDKFRVAQAKRMEDPDYRGKMNAYKRKYILGNTVKRAAHIIVGNAVRDGRLIKEPCEKCGKGKAQAHHDDYEKALEVRWLCVKCHAEHHAEEREAERLKV